MAIKTFFNWSSGKDSAMALHQLLQDNNYSVECLLTTVNGEHDRVSMHGLRTSLLQQQIERTGIMHHTIRLQGQVSNEAYEQVMTRELDILKEKGFECAGFGDIFLEDLKTYREAQLVKVGMKTIFPIWKNDTTKLIKNFTSSGFKAIVVCVNAAYLDSSFLGRLIDEVFLNDLPEEVDPCGENGEFHTFCFDAPFFSSPVLFDPGDTVYKEYDHNGIKSGFYFLDLLPVGV